MDRFAAYIDLHQINWPRLPSGMPDLDKETLKEMTSNRKELSDFYDLRRSLACLKDMRLAVGPDGRNRAALMPFRSITGRCQPSTSNFIFGWPRTWRQLIRPAPGMALAYCDFSQQEYAIAADLSGDPAMLEAYRSGDCYLDFAKRARAVPPNATKKSHPVEREKYKTVTLGLQYCMTSLGLGRRLGMHAVDAQKLIDQHRNIYSRFWAWSDAVLAAAQLRGYLETSLGWRLQVTPDTKPRTIRNFLMQATGAEILRQSCHRLHEDGVEVCAPIHDAVLVQSPIEQIDNIVEVTRKAMIQGGCSLR